MAISGSRIYRDLNRNLDRARADLAQIGQELERANAERDELRGLQTAALAGLARVRLGELDGQRVAGGLDAADRRALELLEQRRATLDRVRAAIADSERQQRDLEAERDDARQTRDAARTERDERAAAALAQLAETEAHAFQRSRVELVSSQAAHADQKASQAEADRETKGRPYEDDKLFAYLWRRRYGFPQYAANRLTRALDDWVARLCRYDRAHRDYGMLLEIPERLRAHATALAEEAAGEARKLAAIEAQALAEAGVTALDEALAVADAALAAVEEKLAAQERRHVEWLEERAALEAGGDAASTEAVATLTRQLESEDVATLRADARRTQSAEDDRLVEELGELRERLRRVDERIEDHQQRQQQALAGMRSLEELRQRFRRRDYDSDDSWFDDGFDSSSLFGGLLRGALAIGEVWAGVGRHQRHRRRSSWSSGGSIFGGSSGSRGGGFGGFGGGGGGGFSSGGGFGGGGGGFKTGGGF